MTTPKELDSLGSVGTMAENYADDEEVEDLTMQDQIARQNGELIEARIFDKGDAPLKAGKFKVLVELIKLEAEEEIKPGLDLVIVLKFDERMKERRSEDLKAAIKTVLKKLCSVDRVSIITITKEARRVCQLRRVTENGRYDLEYLIDVYLKSSIGMVESFLPFTRTDQYAKSSITSGLEIAKKVLKARRFTQGRMVAVLLISDDVTMVSPMEDLPLYTFSFSQDYNPKEFPNIIKIGEAMSDQSSLFPRYLQEKVMVMIHNLTLTITKKQSKIVNVSAGDYLQSLDATNSSVTISFGNLFTREKRSILVDLLLDVVEKAEQTDILELKYSYRLGEQMINSSAMIVRVNRTDCAPISEEHLEILVEEARQECVETISETRKLVEDYNDKLSKATNKLKESKRKFEENELLSSHPTIKTLHSELDQLQKFMEQAESYSKLGSAYAVATERSHAFQRYLSMFTTFKMDQNIDVFQKTDPYSSPSIQLPVTDRFSYPQSVELVEPQRMLGFNPIMDYQPRGTTSILPSTSEERPRKSPRISARGGSNLNLGITQTNGNETKNGTTNGKGKGKESMRRVAPQEQLLVACCSSVSRADNFLIKI